MQDLFRHLNLGELDYALLIFSCLRYCGIQDSKMRCFRNRVAAVWWGPNLKEGGQIRADMILSRAGPHIYVQLL